MQQEPLQHGIFHSEMFASEIKLQLLNEKQLDCKLIQHADWSEPSWKVAGSNVFGLPMFRRIVGPVSYLWTWLQVPKLKS